MYSKGVKTSGTLSIRWFTLLFSIALSFVYSCKTPSIIATQSIQQGDVANNQNDYKTAIQHYENYLSVAPQLGVMRNPILEAEVSRKLAHAYSTQGRYSDAQDNLAHALEMDLQQDDNKLNIIEDYREIGLTNIYQGNYPEALNYINKALLINKGMESSLKAVKQLSIADTYLSKAQLQLTLGQLDSCYFNCLLAKNIYERQDKNGVGLIETNLILGKYYLIFNNTDSAEFYIQHSIKIARDSEYKIYRQLDALGDIELQAGDPESAVLSKLDALKEAKTVNIIPQLIWAHIRVGDIYEVLGNEKKAREYYQSAEELQNTIPQSSALNPSIQLRLGDVQNAYDLFNSSGGYLGANISLLKICEQDLNANRIDSVEVRLTRANQFFKRQNIVEGQAKALLLLSTFYQKQNKYNLSLSSLTEAESLHPGNESLWKIYYQRGVIAKHQNNYEQASSWFEKSITLIENERNSISSSEFKWYYLDNKTDVYDAYITLLLTQPNVAVNEIELAFNLSERARSRTFLDMVASQFRASENIDISKENGLSSQISYVKKMIEKFDLQGIESEELRLRLQNLENEYADIFEQLGRSNPTYLVYNTIAPIDVRELQSSLGLDEVLLEFWVGESNLISWRVSNHKITFAITDSKEIDVKHAVQRVRNSIKYGLENRIVDGFHQLYELLDPVLQGIDKETGKVTIIPHRSLHFIPFEALYGDNYLIENTTIQYAPSASVFEFLGGGSLVASDKKLLGLALGKLQLAGYNSLPGTSIELEQLAQFYPSNKCAYEEEIEESYFKENIAPFNIIHVASHGIMNKYNPAKSYILLAPSAKDDGQLTVEEIYNMKLNAKLVILSACETGLGDLSQGDELIGLSRALLYAGASAVIVSLWKVDDLSTSILMTKVHQNINAGKPIAEALAIAQRDLMHDKFRSSSVRGAQSIEWNTTISNALNTSGQKFNSPYFWAPFILIGTSSTN